MINEQRSHWNDRMDRGDGVVPKTLEVAMVVWLR